MVSMALLEHGTESLSIEVRQRHPIGSGGVSSFWDDGMVRLEGRE